MSSASTQHSSWLAVCVGVGLLAVPAAVADFTFTVHSIDRASQELQARHEYTLRAWIYLAVLTAGLIASIPLVTAKTNRTARNDMLRRWYGRATGVAALTATGLSYATYVVHYRDHQPTPALQIWIATGVLLGVTLYLRRESSEPATARLPRTGHDAPQRSNDASRPAVPDDHDPQNQPPALALTDRQAIITSLTLCVAAIVLAGIALPTGCGSATPAIGALFFAGIMLGLFGLWCLCTRHWVAGLLPIILAGPLMYLSTLGAVCESLRLLGP